MKGKTVTEERTSAFHEARLLACNSSCERCGKFRKFPEGVALHEEQYCESVWLCEECFPDSAEEDEENEAVSKNRRVR